MQRTNGSIAHRARPLFVVATLVCSVALAFTPSVPSVIALSSPEPSASTDPGQSIAPDPTPTPDPTPSPSPTPTPEPTPAASPDPTPDASPVTSPDPSAIPDPTPIADPDPTPTPTPDADPVGSPDPSPAPSATPVPGPVEIRLDQQSDAPAEGRHRISPGADLTLEITATPVAAIGATVLSEQLPTGWFVVDAGGGALDPGTDTVTWHLGDIAGGERVSRSVVVRAPRTSPQGGGQVFEGIFAARLVHAGGSQDADALRVLVAPHLVVEHARLAQVADRDASPTYLAEDVAILDEQRFDVFRVRFQLRNADDLPVRITPQLEFQIAGGVTSTVVPSLDSKDGVAFYVADEWVPLGGPLGGSKPGPSSETIRVGDLKIHGVDGADQRPITGYHSMGANPMPTLTIPGRSLTEIEFSVRGTVDARYLTRYEFRITDGDATLDGAVTAQVRFGSRPGLLLSPGQQDGVDVGDPLTPAGAGLVDYRLTTPDSQINQPIDAIAIATTETVGRQRYTLAVSADPSELGPTYALTAPFENPHVPSLTLTSDTCAACHGSHSAEAPNLLTEASPQAGVCFTCHDSVGTGATSPVQAEYEDLAIPVNVPGTRSYYSHDALAPDSGHTLAENDEFGGLSNRHSECADCHQPHRATDARGAMTTEGWTTPGPLDGVSAVAVTNGAAGSAPTYALLDGKQDQATLEYQLCFKCHSGFTVLPSNTDFTPSKYTLDKAIEFNPANGSYHPIEAAGTNATSQMAASLLGLSPFKQWNFSTDSTIRCLNCHASSDRFDETAPWAGADEVAANANLPAHTSTNRGILLQNYRDRDLKGPLEYYDANDFALCYTCHAEAPFADISGEARSDTNFSLHGLHVNGTDLRDTGVPGSDIDQAGIGSGLAVCAECHYRIHSTTFAVNGQPAGSRLVNFAPNVTAPTGGSLGWLAKTPTQDGTCALKCHSKGHIPKSY